MNREAMRGEDFSVSGAIQTENSDYVILVNESVSAYFPVPCAAYHSFLVSNRLSDTTNFDVDSYGIYYTFLSLFKAHGISLSCISFSVGKSGKITCDIEVVEENELGFKVSKIPMLIQDGVVLSSLCKMPITIYGAVGKDFALRIDKGIPKDNIFPFICEEIARSEKINAIDADES